MLAFGQQPGIHVLQRRAEMIRVFFNYRLGVFGITDTQSVIGRIIGQNSHKETAFINFFRRHDEFAAAAVHNIHTYCAGNQNAHYFITLCKAVSSQISEQVAVGGKKQAFDRIALDLIKFMISLDLAVCFHAYLVNNGKLAAHEAVL